MMESRSKDRYNTEEAVQYILEPGSDSELSELSSDDECPDEEVSILHEPEALEEETVNGTGDEKSYANGAEDSPDAETVFKWRKKEPAAVDITFSGTELTCPDNVNELNPFMYFKMFWEDGITQNIVEQTNLHSVQQTGSSILTTKDEIETFFGLQMKMSIVKMPNYEMYWENQTRYEQVASVMPSKRYKKNKTVPSCKWQYQKRWIKQQRQPAIQGAASNWRSSTKLLEDRAGDLPFYWRANHTS